MKAHLDHLFSHQTLDRKHAQAAMREIITGEHPPEQISAFLGALRSRGETSEELAGFVDEMLSHALLFQVPTQPRLLDVCGTGGDSAGTFNLSTACSLLLASMGIPVSKHGNRSVSSRCGSIDVLEALGISYATNPQEAERQLKQHSVCYLFAPHFHPALKKVGPIRKSIGSRTTFNILGPLANPSGVTHQLIGVYEPQLTRTVAETLALRGCARALIIHSDDGMDEFSLSAPTRGHLWDGSTLTQFEFDPSSLFTRKRSLSELRGGDASENARIIVSALEQIHDPSWEAHREAIALNAGAAQFVFGTAPSLKEGYLSSYQAIKSGTALAHLKSLQQAGAAK